MARAQDGGGWTKDQRKGEDDFAYPLDMINHNTAGKRIDSMAPNSESGM